MADMMEGCFRRFGVRQKITFVAFGIFFASGCATRERNEIEEKHDARAVPPHTQDAGSDGRLDSSSCGSSVSGIVRFPNGVQSAPNALVYVKRTGHEVASVGKCGQCVALEDVYAHTLTDAAGAFSIEGLAPGDYELVVQKGKFVRTISVGLLQCGESLYLNEDETRLPKEQSEGEIPRIAVGTGSYDSMETVLARLGLGEIGLSGTVEVPRFSLYSGNFADPYLGLDDLPPLEELLRSPDELFAYDILFLDCGSSPDDFSNIFSEERVVENIRAWVENGGRLYVTDQAYDYVEQIFPAQIDFEGGGLNGFRAVPETEDSAELGIAAEVVYGTIHDETLAAWLEREGVLEGEQVPIVGLASNWAVVSEVSDAVKTWVSGEILWSESGDWKDPDQYIAEVKPLTVTFSYGCGRVLYTSYHTKERSVGGSTKAELNAQELVLAYLALEIGECVADPVLF